MKTLFLFSQFLVVDGAPPEVADEVVAADGHDCGGKEGADVHWDDDLHEFVYKGGRKPVHGKKLDHKVQVLGDRGEGDDVADEEFTVENERHGYGVGDPDKADAERHVKAHKRHHENDGRHLQRHGDKSEKKSDEHRF